ncbi:MAG: hypothetical protein M1832_002030 [Thelocarpon impressellum]|nr:MAG: hypothetical protein M1832_002030 [Thelocarpon impressellum]
MPPRARSRSHAAGPTKKLIVACDGTWMNSDNGIDNTSLLSLDPRPKPQIPSNVTRICRAIEAEARDGTPQVIYYQAGVGTGPGVRDKVIGGATGLGLSENIREAYDFIANNYHIDDEIILIGFSRGAFTARSIAGLIGGLGVLTKAGMDDFYAIFKDYENAHDPDYRSPFPNVPFPDKPNALDPEYRLELSRRGLTTLDVPVKAVAVWDTVGALGIPRLGWLDKVGIVMPDDEYCFHDTVVGGHVENAFQALALDEQRPPFAPSVWLKPRQTSTYLKQVWFPGVHSNVGGGYEDTELANITLAWMMSELAPFLTFSRSYFSRQVRLNRQYYVETGQDVRPWSFGEIYDSMKGIYVVASTEVRTPGEYNTYSRHLEIPIYETNEFVHASARARIGLRGPGVEDEGTYDCLALHRWENVVRRREVDGELRREIVWEKYDGRDDTRLVLPEDTLGPFELDLLNSDPAVRDRILGSSSRRRVSRTHSHSHSHGGHTQVRSKSETRVETRVKKF